MLRLRRSLAEKQLNRNIIAGYGCGVYEAGKVRLHVNSFLVHR